MLLLDFSQIMISNIFVNIRSFHDKPVDINLPDLGNSSPGIPGNKTKIEEDLLRHMVLNSLRYYHTKFKEKYGQMVICCDSGHYWRKEIFPFYKANRKKTRDSSGLDWKIIFDSLNKIREEIKEYLPYKVLNIDGCEADDIIAVVAKREHTAEKVLILSCDKDFQNLQKYPNIEQYAPVQKKFIKCNNPIEFLREHIMIGDSGDGVPNFLSPDDCFVQNIRQTPIRKDKLSRWVKESKPENFCDIKMLRGYRRNERLISFDKIPQEIQESILTEWESPFTESRKHLFDYFVKYKLMQMMDRIQEF
jgi:hypothetical protein